MALVGVEHAMRLPLRLSGEERERVLVTSRVGFPLQKLLHQGS
jgi:hypothetical protein